MPQVPISIEEYYQPKDDNNLTTASKNIVGAINEINTSSGNVPWIVGEYKWMPIDSASIMPVGWVKISFPANGAWTLSSAAPNPQVDSHIYVFSDSFPTTDAPDLSGKAYMEVDNGKRNSIKVNNTVFVSKDSNKKIVNWGVASIEAELWQYKPS